MDSRTLVWTLSGMSSMYLSGGSTEEVAGELKAWVDRRKDCRGAAMYMHRTLFTILHTTTSPLQYSHSPSKNSISLLRESIDSRTLV